MRELSDKEVIREARVLLQLWFAAEEECEKLKSRLEAMVSQIEDLERAMADPCPRCGEKP